MDERKNIFDIAKEAGVSIATVSRVVSGGANVRPQTREKVLRVVEKYNFTPSMIATGLSKRKSHTLGVVLPLIDNPFYTQLCMAAQKEAQRLNFSLMLFQLERNQLHSQSLTGMLTGKRLDGVLFSGDVVKGADYSALGECVAQVRRYMPAVVINPATMGGDCPCLYTDLGAGTRIAISHLRRLGHQRIAMIGGQVTPTASDPRETTYFETMREEGLSRYIYPMTSGETAAEGELCAAQLLSQLGPLERPTALVAFNDLVALGAIKQLLRMGYNLPGDMALVGCDNQFFAPYTQPPLTTLDLRIEEIARQAVQLLERAQEREAGAFSQTFEPALVVRESCGARLSATGITQAQQEFPG